MASSQHDPSLSEQLDGIMRGPVLGPEDPGYNEARAVWNGMIDARPALIARPRGAADVRAGVKFGRDHGLTVTAKGGGHGFSGAAVRDGGLMLDFSDMSHVRVDPEARTARVGPGATLGDFDHEAQAFGLATTGGVDSRTGVAGLTLGGGLGWLGRSYGLTADNLLSADVVAADGRIVRASEDENPDLFWGLRGGGGAFGVVTSFEFQLHEVGPEVMNAQVFYPVEDAEETFRFYRDFMADADDRTSCYALVVGVPPAAPFPEARHGEPAVALVACHSGSIEEGKEALAPLEEHGEPLLRAVQPIPYVALQSTFDAGYPDGERYYGKSCYLNGLPDEAIETLLKHGIPLAGSMTAVFLEPMGGAINRKEPGDTAFPHRDGAFSFGITTGWSDPARDDEMIAWTRRLNEAMIPFGDGGVYVNYMDGDELDRVPNAYGENYERLTLLKAEWDPENLFGTRGIRPAGD